MATTRRRALRRVLTLITAMAMLTASTALLVPASADPPDAETVGFIALIDDLEDFVGDLGTAGALGQPVPSLDVIPGGPEAMGLADLLSQARTHALGGPTFDGASSIGALVDKIDGASADLADGRTISFTASKTDTTTPRKVTVGFTASRTVTTARLDVSDDAPDFSLASEGGVTATLGLSGSFELNRDDTTGDTWISHGASTPSLGLTVGATIPDPDAVAAGVGILGIELDADSTFALDATLGTAWTDPNNDGRLAFDAPGGGADDGELGAAGAAAGLVDAALTGGSLAASLHLVARPSTTIDLGDADLTVSVTAANLATDTPQVAVTSGSLASIESFLTLSPRDLAQGLAQAASAVLGLQNRSAVELPFMRGDLADAIGAVEAIQHFLETHVPEPVEGSLEPGLPTFVSLQDFLEQLEEAPSPSIAAAMEVLDATYDAAGKKVSFTLVAEREAPTTALNLNPVGAPLTGTATYTNTSLTDASRDFGDLEGVALAGRQVTVGGSTAIIKEVSGSTLTLDPAPFGSPAPSVLWQGGKPSNGSVYAIEANDPKIGLVEMGDAMKDAGAIRNANAKVAAATVKPSYRLEIPMVLDLRAPDTSDCNPDPGATAACPYKSTDAVSGITTIIPSLPLPADRIMLRTSDTDLLVANAPVSTSVDVEALVGFVKIKLNGSLKMCSTGGASDCTGNPTDDLVTIGLTSLVGEGADADGDIPIPAFVAKLAEAVASDTLGDLISVDINGRAHASLTLSVPGAPQFFGGSPATVTVAMADITDPSNVAVTGPQLDKLLALEIDPDNPLALFGALLTVLETLNGSMSELDGPGLSTQIPVLGRSVSELIGSGASGGGSAVTYADGTGDAADKTILTDTSRTFSPAYIGRRVAIGTEKVIVTAASGNTLTLAPGFPAAPAAGSEYVVDSELRGFLNLLSADPAESLQDMLDTLAAKLGGGSTATFKVEDGTPHKFLRLDIDWKRSHKQQSPVSFSFDLGGTKSLVGAEGSGVVDITTTGQVKLAVRIPLSAAAVADPASSIEVDPTASFVKAGVLVNGDGTRFAAQLGPFEASLGNPTGDPGTQLRAGLDVELSSSGSAPESLSTFFGNLGVDVGGDGVECSSAPVAAGTDLALCAYFPLYINGAAVNADPAKNAFIIRLPVGTDLADTFDIAGADVGGHPRFTTPDGLAAALENAALNLLPFGDGFFAYLEFLQQALETASFDGKLPLIGQDLQAGSDFLGKLRSDLEAVWGSVPTDPTAKQIRDFFNDEVKPKLPGQSAFTFDVVCNIVLEPAPKPGVSVTRPDSDAMADKTYRYKVVAYTNNPPEETKHSPASDSVTNGETLSNDRKNTVSWAAVDNATGYKVLRSEAGGPFKLLKDVGGATSYVDEGADTPGPAAHPEAAEKPLVVPCPGDASGSQIRGISLSVDIGQGNPTATEGCVGGSGCLSHTIPFDLGLPGLSIAATDSTSGITASLGWRLHLKLALDRDHGFSVHTQDTTAPEFVVGASLDVPDTLAQLAFVNVDLKNNGTTPEFVGAFSIDLRDEDVPATNCVATCVADTSRRLTIEDLKTKSIDEYVFPVLNAAVDIDWNLKATVSSALPGIGADFLLGWSWSSNAAPDDTTGLHTLAFNNVVVDPGDFLGKTIGPIVKQVVDIFKPVQPILDTIEAPIPVISDLSRAVGGGDVTIRSLAVAFSTLAGGPDIEPFLEVLANIRTLVKALSGDCGGGSFCVSVGSFNLLPDKVVDTDANPATADSLIDKSNGFSPNSGMLDDLDDTTGGDLQGTGGAHSTRGFSFPALEEPSKLFGLIMGQDVELARFDSGPLTLGFEFQQSFGPIYAPPPVNVVVGGGASVTLRVVAGFDTYGIRTAIESGKLDAKILDSLYFVTTEGGKPIPVVQFEGFLQAGASVSAVVIEVGIVGGIKLTVGFFWNDPNNDGKFRFSEFLTAALSNPICLFNVGGELSLFIKVFITLGISPFSVSFDFELVNIKLLDFSLKPNCEPEPPKLGGTSGGVLYLFAGKLGNGGERGDPFWNNKNSAEETWVIRQKPAKGDQPPKITVQALGITEEFKDPGGNTIHTVVFDGRNYGGSLQVMFQGGDKGQAFTKKTVVATGNGKDVIRTGEGESWVDGGKEKDTITTFDRQDLSKGLPQPAAHIAGGGGPDVITAGNAANKVMGDGALGLTSQGAITVNLADDPDTAADESTATKSISGALNPNPSWPASPATENAGTDDADQIAVGLGGSEIFGNGGADIIGTANDNPQADLPSIKGTPEEPKYRAQKNTIVGGAGGDRIKSGNANDVIFTGSHAVIDPDSDGAGDAASDTNTVDTGEGSDIVYGSNGKDFVTTHSTTTQSATVYGGGADDVIIGANGTDKLYGGPGNDYLIATPATVSLDTPIKDDLGSARKVTFLSSQPVTVAKTLVGGGGSDRIYGADGPSTIYGDRQVDACVLQSDPVSKQPPENPTTSGGAAVEDASDLIIGGAGVDTVQAGGGGDFVYLFAASDVACGSGGADTVFAGADEDLVYGGSGNDVIHGDSHADQLYANTGDDTVYAGTGDDRVQGNEGEDELFGGGGADLLIGGTSKAATADTLDRIFGEAGNDLIVGDNADSDVTPAYPTDLATGDLSHGGPDKAWGGEGADRMFGGLEADTFLGGNGTDVIEGNHDADTLSGEAGADDIMGGSSQAASPGVGHPDGGDTIDGGADDDVVIGDNGTVATVAPGAGSPLTKGRGLSAERSITLLDLGHGVATGRFGGDTIDGGTESDVILGQRGTDTIDGGAHDDYVEGGQDADTIDGGSGQDDLVGGSYHAHTGSGQATVGQLDAGDTINGGIGGDVAIGDNGAVLRDPAAAVSPLTMERGIALRSIALYDLGDAPTANTAGADLINGNGGADVLLAQAGDDRVRGDGDDDYAEGGQGSDWIEGGTHDDDLVGGSSSINGSDTGTTAKGQPDGPDVLFGQGGDDLMSGDNAVLTRVAPHDGLTRRVRPDGTLTTQRSRRLLDLSNSPGGELTSPDAIRFGADLLSGQAGVDVVFGQDGNDAISGGSGDDYAEGNGGDDQLFGDRSLTTAGIALPNQATWPGPTNPAIDTDGLADGQDDLLGGTSRPGFRDGSDVVHGDGESDFILGDNGTVVRDVTGNQLDGFADRIYALRYDPASLPASPAKIRVADSSHPSTRFCTTAQATCEPGGASGADSLHGDGGDDWAYGQDGDDLIWGGGGDDDLYGELGNDRIWGEAGDDAILGDRGGVRRIFQDGTHTENVTMNHPPRINYTARRAGTVVAASDLLHDINGDVFVGSGAGAAMPHDGITTGGDDRIRGGSDRDSIHAGFGDDLANGDSGGDRVFGGDGADVLWGGRGCDPVDHTPANAPDCYPGGVYDRSARGDDDRFVDYVFGGKGAINGPSVHPTTGSQGSDVIDWEPRGTYNGGAGCTTNPWPVAFGAAELDPCAWFEMTNTTDGDEANDQHHHGIDWQYGGWDRDVLQGDVADNGPNEGDRMMDWNGAYNLYTHCNAAYGGFNDVRNHNPATVDFLQRFAYGEGAGQSLADTTTAGSSAFIELAIVYPKDNKAHGSGKAYPSTPGHFHEPACQ